MLSRGFTVYTHLHEYTETEIKYVKGSLRIVSIGGRKLKNEILIEEITVDGSKGLDSANKAIGDHYYDSLSSPSSLNRIRDMLHIDNIAEYQISQTIGYVRPTEYRGFVITKTDTQYELYHIFFVDGTDYICDYKFVTPEIVHMLNSFKEE